MFTNGTVVINEQAVPVLDVRIDPGEDSDPENLGFTWRAVSQTPTTLTIQLIFENALYISANPIKDTLRITIVDPLMFFGANGLLVEKKNREITRDIPAQLSESAKEVQQAIDNASQGARAAMGLNFLVTLLLSASLNYLLGMVNTY